MSKASILVVEDNWELREALSDTLEYAGYDVKTAESGEAALHLLTQSRVDMVVSDINMDGMDGHELLQQLRARFPVMPVVLITAFGSIGSSVRAMREGAVDYLLKPFKPEQLLATVEKYLTQKVAAHSDPIAIEPSSQQMLGLAKKVAQSDATVLISGESGTGKEVLAQYIHQQSKRASGPFIAINCAAIPENMLEATLFGHEKGSFTGAYQSSPGKFEQADGGTILLDEISEMDIGLQAKILRVLQEREVERLGSRKTLQLDVRVIATTNRDLRACVRDGRFREDLFYRLSVFPLAWQPLRHRRQDIVPLAERLLQQHAARMGRGVTTLGEQARQDLMSYDWPGNVRELDNVLQRALIIQDGNIISAASLGLDSGNDHGDATAIFSGQGAAMLQDSHANDESAQSGNEASTMHASAGNQALGNDLKQREFEVILQTLKRQRGRRKETAEALGVSARTLRYKLARMRDMGINIDSLVSA
ncbi:sigma-54 dependent transcriptional regulator [Pseudohongiella acticola]|jgi:two-component system, response regulator FlrC|uniref:sigma-54-dependent transcriptional regulator n=1 Tax=Pseudohongiella acticola TaxID=1524254 RepID=UPI0030EF138A